MDDVRSMLVTWVGGLLNLNKESVVQTAMVVIHRIMLQHGRHHELQCAEYICWAVVLREILCVFVEAIYSDGKCLPRSTYVQGEKLYTLGFNIINLTRAKLNIFRFDALKLTFDASPIASAIIY